MKLINIYMETIIILFFLEDKNGKENPIQFVILTSIKIY